MMSSGDGSSLTVESFGLLETGSLGHLEYVPLENSTENLTFPLLTLPVGIPPVLSSLEQEVESYVNQLENLPIHNFAASQKLINRQLKYDRLLYLETCIPETTIQVERNQTTGQLLGYTEEIIPDSSETSRNSLSLRRAPDVLNKRANQDVRGSNINLPFWPGGLDVDILQDSLSTKTSDTPVIDFDDESQYLTTPPGFEYGMTFKKSLDSVAAELTQGPNVHNEQPGIISLEEIMSGTDELDLGDSGDEEPRPASDTQDKESVQPQLSRSESLDKLVEGENNNPQGTEKRPQPSKEQWAVQVDVTAPVDDFHKRIPVMAYKWPFELDIFQKQAILHLESHDSVFVAAHTSAGKTVVAEYAIALSIKHMARTIYTSPIKALSNQKFREFKDTFSDVGLVTGDVQLNPTASCLIMTTEILRSMLYNGSDIIRDLEWVIFDEVHYINDSERGVVWEEVLIMLPAHVSVVLLSATVPNCMEFADWVGRIKKKKIYVVSTLKRPVPLEHFLYTGNSIKTCNELFLLVDAKGSFLNAGYAKALEAKKERASKSSQSFGAKGTRAGAPNQEKNTWLSVIEMLKKREILPAVAFTFSKKKIEEVSGNLQTVDLTTATEKSEIHIFFHKCISRLKGTDKELPQVLQLADLLKRGLGVHHSGILPILKEMVEMLFQRGLVKILFATETFAMGVNMPAKTVVFDSIRKYDGLNLRNLLPGEYIQMAGRAGRRGLDTTGTVILLCKGDVPEASELHKMMLGKPTALESHFRLTYSMILNLLRAEQLRVQEMIKRSFSEFHHQKDSVKHRESLDKLKEKMAAIKDIECYLCALDLEKYHQTCRDYHNLQRQLQSVIFSHPTAIKSMSPGRVVMVKYPLGQSVLGVVLASSMGNNNERKFKTLVLTEKNENMKQMSNEEIEPVLSSSLYLPEGPCGQVVAELTSNDIRRITTKVIKVEADDMLRDCSKRELARFKDDPPDRSVITATQELVQLTESDSSGLPGLHPINDLKLKDIELVEDCRALQFMEEEFPNFNCIICPQFLDHFKEHNRNMKLKDDHKKLVYLLSDESLQLLPEYSQRVEVLKRLECIDSNCAVKLKGKVACEMSTHEVMITELLFNSVLSSLHPADIAASLSCFVFEMKKCSEPELSDTLLESKKKIIEIAETIGTIQKQVGMQEAVQDYVEQYHFGLMEVVFEWARGLPFSEIITLTDVHEGIIVRTIQRLHELLSDVRNAARLIGDRTLLQKMEETMSLIKRDIVFAASLYTQ